jgi:hypothetical protein
LDTFVNPRRRPTPPAPRITRRARGRIALVLLLAALLAGASACDTAEQVPWATYDTQLQQQIDDAAATHNCAALQALLQAARATSSAHEKASGIPNNALEAYIQNAQASAGCPAGSG